MRVGAFGRAAAPLSGMLGLLVATAGCSSETSGFACVEKLSTSCAPLYSPVFHEVFTRTLHPTCAQSGTSCHSADGHQHGLVFEEEDAAYALLLGWKDGRARVIPGDPACSLMIERIESTTSPEQMPPGNPLSDPEKCALVQWVQAGAKR